VGGSGKYGDEPSGSGTMVLVRKPVSCEQVLDRPTEGGFKCKPLCQQIKNK
jgi:hypothetical protein